MGETAVSVSHSVVLGGRIDAEFLSDMGELFRVHEAPVCHHRAQGHQARLGEEQPWKVAPCIKPHKATRDQPLRRRRELRLAGIGAAAPGLEVKALATLGDVEKKMSSSRRM